MIRIVFCSILFRIQRFLVAIFSQTLSVKTYNVIKIALLNLTGSDVSTSDSNI